jgi:hypothetical protein
VDATWGESRPSRERVHVICPAVFHFQYEPVAGCDPSVGSWASRHATARARPMSPVALSAIPTNCWMPTQMLSRRGYTSENE